MIRFTADDEFNVRLEESAYQMYQLVKHFRDPDWEHYVKEHGVRQRTIDMLDYIENGIPDWSDLSTELHKLGG